MRDTFFKDERKKQIGIVIFQVLISF